jgi:hypothetical protein
VDLTPLRNSSSHYKNPLPLRNVAYDSCDNFYDALIEVIGYATSCGYCNPPWSSFSHCMDCYRMLGAVLEMISYYYDCVGLIQ